MPMYVCTYISLYVSKYIDGLLEGIYEPFDKFQEMNGRVHVL
jgi:hypothetical protein